MNTPENIGATNDGSVSKHGAKRSNGREQDHAVATIGDEHEKNQCTQHDDEVHDDRSSLCPPAVLRRSDAQAMDVKILRRSRSSSAMILALMCDRLPQQIANRYDGNYVAAVDHRQMANAVLMHQPQAIGERVRKTDGDDIADHDVRDRSCFGRFFAKDNAPSAIALRNNADQPSLLKNHDANRCLVGHLCSADRTLSAGPTAHRVRGFDARTSLKDRKAKISSGRLMGCSMLTLDPLKRLRVRATEAATKNSSRYYSNVGSIRQYTLV